MKTEDLILDIIGLIFIVISVIFFVMEMITFYEGTLIGVTGLALFVLKGSVIRKYVIKLIEKYLGR